MERRERAGRVAIEAMEGERAVRFTGGMAAEKAMGGGEEEKRRWGWWCDGGAEVWIDGCCLLAGDDDDKFARGAGLSELELQRACLPRPARDTGGIGECSS